MRKFKRQQGQDIYKYTLSNLNLRSSKSTSGNVITVIPEGSRVQVVDAAEDWYEVIYNGQRGYVYNQYLSQTKYTWTQATLRPYPDGATNSIDIVPAKTRVQVLGTVGDWSHVIYDDKEGYIFSSLLTDDGNPPNDYDFTYFQTDMLRFVNDNEIKSPTNILLTTDLTNKLTYVFEKNSNGTWRQLYKWSCDVGKPSTPTITGTFYITGRKPYFGSDTYRVKYATRIRGSYYYHTILFDPQGNEIIDATLGAAITHGCIRLAVENARWIYDNVLDSSAVVIH